MIDKPTPGSTGAAGDAGQHSTSGELQTRIHDDRHQFFHRGRWHTVFSGGADDGDGGDGGNGNPDAGGSSGDEKVTLTKAELDARMADVRKGVESSLSKKFADYDDLKTKATQLDELKNADKTESQKLQEAIKERDEKLQSLPSTVRRQTLRFVALADKKGFIDAEDAFLHVGDVDLDDAAALEKALDELAARKPHLVGKNTPRGDGGGGPRGGSGDDTDMSSRIRRMAAGARS